MAYTVVGKKQYILLGKLLMRKHPDIANDFLTNFVDIENESKNLEKITTDYLSFCKLLAIDPEQYKGGLFKTEKVEIRRLFISAMLHLYSPKVYLQPPDSIVLRYNLIKKICDIIHYDNGGVSRIIREVITMERVYDDYRNKVADMVANLKKINDGSKKEKDQRPAL